MLDDYFKHEERRRGEEIFKKDAVFVSSNSDTSVRAFVKSSSSCKVSFTADGVASQRFMADCTCTTARKGILCKHIWAVVLKLAGSDFLETKSEVEKASTGSSSTPTARTFVESEARVASREAAKERQSLYRKTQYAKQKARAKEMRQGKKSPKPELNFLYPDPVEEAREYFAANGFILNHPLDLELLIEAKKSLSQIFHPDKGGSHEESVLLNENFEIIYSYLKD